MLKACPNQKIARIIMNIKGNTAAASAISLPLVSQASLRRIDLAKFSMLGDRSDFPEYSIQHNGKCERHSVRDLERVGIIERNPRPRKPESDKRDQDVPDIPHRLNRSSLVDHQRQRHHARYKN